MPLQHMPRSTVKSSTWDQDAGCADAARETQADGWLTGCPASRDLEACGQREGNKQTHTHQKKEPLDSCTYI